jgi:peptidoglycan/LPS O-acetylase OafA/YrhL
MSERYDNLDGLRAYAAIGIVMMHVLANSKYALHIF